MKIIGGFSTNVGRVRKVNQDSIFCRIAKKKKSYISLSAVCDGVGGLEHGEIASALIVNNMEEWWNSIMSWIDIETVDTDILFAHLKDAAEEWNLILYDYMRVRRMDMGTTMSMCLTIRDKYYIIQVGDSRVYLYRSGNLFQLTTDATENRLKSGSMKPYLTNYMGMSAELFFTTASGTLECNDLILTCCDGLYHNLLLEDVKSKSNFLGKEKKLEQLSNMLVETMMQRGERDNISVVLLSVLK